jgi:hypothetical protein
MRPARPVTAPFGAPCCRCRGRRYRDDVTEDVPAVVLSHPPVSLLHAANPVVKLLMRTPLSGRLRKQVMVVNVTGRRTGRRYSIPLSAHRIDGDLYALSSASWKHNFRNGVPCVVLLGGKTMHMRGELIEDRDVIAGLSRRCAESYGVRRAQPLMGLKFRGGQLPTVEEFADAVDRHHYAAVRFTQ